MAGITSEPRTYGPHSDHSFFQDLALVAVPGEIGSADAKARLERHRVEVDGEIRVGSDEGRRARALLKREEQRAGASSSTTAGFTTPQYLTNLWAEFRTAERTFIDQTNKYPLPGYGLQVNIPSFTSATNTGQQTELHGIDDSSASGANIQQNVVTIAGSVPVSQQLNDRGGMTGLTFDQILLAQLKVSVDSQTDLYAISQVTSAITATGNTITDNSAFSISNFYADIAKAREALADGSGTRLKATHVFSSTDLFSFVTRQVDDSHRPIVTPDWAAEPWNSLMAAGDSAGDGWLGHILPGNMAWFSDDNIPALSGNNQIIVSRPSSVLSFESDIIPFAYPETHANNLTVVVGVRKYTAVAARFANASAVITGSAYVNTEI